jgi:hypothetical protein
MEAAENKLQIDVREYLLQYSNMKYSYILYVCLSECFPLHIITYPSLLLYNQFNDVDSFVKTAVGKIIKQIPTIYDPNIFCPIRQNCQ